MRGFSERDRTMNIRRLATLIVGLSLACAPATSADVATNPDPWNFVHTIVVGEPPTTPADAVDTNSTTSPFAGVIAVQTDDGSQTYFGSGFAVDATHIITAAHTFDTNYDGVVDVNLGDTDFTFNFGSTTTQSGLASVTLHPGWGSGNPFHDDVAIVELNSPIPGGMPTYNLSPYAFLPTNNSSSHRHIYMVGYGKTGTGLTGYSGDPNALVKRVGENIASTAGEQVAGISHDDDSAARIVERFLYDFDRDVAFTADPLNDGTSLGNDREVTIAPGDSGGPALLWNDHNNDSTMQNNELSVFGINTHASSYYPYNDDPDFGSVAGGVVASSVGGWAQRVLSDPTNGFSGNYAPNQWTKVEPENSSVDDSGAPETVVITSVDDVISGGAYTEYKVTLAGDGTVSFNWEFIPYDSTPGKEVFGYMLDGVRTSLSSPDPNHPTTVIALFGSESIAVTQGQEFGFYVQSIDGAFDPGEAIIDRFSAPIPEPATLLLAGLGVTVLTHRRRVRTGS